MERFYVYTHAKQDTGEVFYVGKGEARRHLSRCGRNEWWKRTVAKHGLKSEIIERFADEADAFAMERYLIASYRALGTALVNMTDGGEGASGRRLGAIGRQRISIANKGLKRTPENVAAHREFMRTWRHSEESKAKIGSGNLRHRSEFGTCGGRPARPLRCVETGRIFAQRIEAVEWLRVNGWPKADSPSIKRAMERASRYAYGLHWEHA